MNLYKITVEKVTDKTHDKYASDVTVYEQIVEGDDSIVNAVVATVLEYNRKVTTTYKVIDNE